MPRFIIIAVISISLIPHAYAASPLHDLDASADIAVDLSGTIATGNQTARDNLSGTITLQVFTSVAENADLVAYERSANGALLTFDTSINLPSTPSAITVRPADVVSFDGVNYTKVFDGLTAGIPDGAHVDAVATEGSDLLVSFDITVDLGGGLTVADEDLVHWDGGNFTLHFDASLAGIDLALDLDGAHRLINGNLLLSFDGSGSIGTPAVFFDDEDILEYDPTGAMWELAYDASAQVAGWADGPDLDAFDVTELLIVGVPFPPTMDFIQSRNEALEVYFSPGPSVVEPISSYEAKCGDQVTTGSGSPLTVTNLDNGVQYSCSVTASNIHGQSIPSGTLFATPDVASVPPRPTITSMEPDDYGLLVRFTIPNDGGAPTTDYTVTCGGISASGSDSPIIVRGLTNDQEYSCTVIATNLTGASPPSAPVS